jgi:cell division protein FtsQ
MDGGGRLLRSLTESATNLFTPHRLRLAGVPASFEAPAYAPSPPRASRLQPKTGFWTRRAIRGGPGGVLVLALFLGVGLYGATRNGDYADFVKSYGAPTDLAAKALGFPIDAIALTGQKVLEPREILDAAAITPRNSLLFLDAAGVRDRLKTVPLVRDAVITKLFPDRLTIALDERDPVAIWQLDGKLSIVSGDGVVIDDIHDGRFVGLPFVVGDGANTKVGEFLALLDGAGELRSRIVAGIRVGDRRWRLKMDNGTVVDLPELHADRAVAQLVALDKQARLLDKDVVSVDLRIPGRVTARLSDDAAAARAEMLAKKSKGKGTPE